MAMIEKTIDIKELMCEKIKNRYMEITPTTHTTASMVIDSMYPTFAQKAIMGIPIKTGFGKRVYAISEFIAKDLGVTKMPFEDIALVLGYKKKDLKNIIDNVKSKGYVLHLLGFGGTGTNFYHWLNEICILTNTVNIFEQIIVWDDDKVDLTNIFRIPFDINFGSVRLTSNANGILKTSLAYEHIASTRSIAKEPKRLEHEHLESFGDNHIFYGAPDIETREMLMNENRKFISGTHGDSECQLYINPPQNSMLQVESYGMINLSIFFMNQAKMTIEFLKLLGSEDDLVTSKCVMEYDFQKEYIDGSLSAASRTYKFPVTIQTLAEEEPNDEL